MNPSVAGWGDTIVALATPPGVGAIGVVRLSGPNAFAIANQLFPSKDLEAQASHTLHVGLLKREGQVLDEVVASLYRGPRSFTGEDVVELSCHGSPFVQQQVIEACIAGGARLAKPGEFTQRAFLNGKMDLAQAEAVADLIAANTEASRRTALQQMRGGFSQALRALREELIRFSALIELELDFSQEDVEFADRGQFRALVEEIDKQVGALLLSFKLGNVIRNGVSTAIIGRPNAGKSTLLNALLNEERAIVSDIPGTTRDTVEEVLNIGGILFRLIDTAGIRAHAADAIERVGIARSREKMRAADLVLYLFDAAETAPEELAEAVRELEGATHLLVGNKTDRLGAEAAREKFNAFGDIIFLSARGGEGLEALTAAMTDRVLQGGVGGEDAIVTNARHYAALQQVQGALADIRQGLDSGLPGDLLALDIRRALQYLGEITGAVTNEDQLDFIFSKFCIGK